MVTISATHNPPGCGCAIMVIIILGISLAIHPIVFFIVVSVIALVGSE